METDRVYGDIESSHVQLHAKCELRNWQRGCRSAAPSTNRHGVSGVTGLKSFAKPAPDAVLGFDAHAASVASFLFVQLATTYL